MTSTRRPAWFRSFLSRYKRSVAVALTLGLVGAGFSALLMFASGYLISATAQSGITLFAILLPVAFVQVFGLGRPLARYLERLVSHDWVLRVTSDLRAALFRGIGRRFGDPRLARPTGEYLGLLNDDVAHLQNLYLRVVFPTVVGLLLAVSASVVFGFFSFPFALIMLLVFALTVGLLPFATLLATRALQEQAKALKAAETADLADDVMGSVDWVLAGRGDEATRIHGKSDDTRRRIDSRVRMTQRALSLAGTLALGIALCTVIAWSGESYGGNLAMANWIAAFALGFFPLIESFATLPAAVSEWPVHEDALVRLDDVMDSEDQFPAVSARQPAPEAAQPISVQDVSYTYPGASRKALDRMSIRIEAGAKVAVLGRSGSGKSTLASLVRGDLKPDEGRVLVGDTDSAHADDLSRTVGYLGQAPYLFNRSLRDNLAIGRPDASDDAILAALASVGLSDRLAALSDGLDTIIGETGEGFSGGEAHRIALARVLVADTPVVLVDEPFAALDPESEAALLDALFDACANRTLVVITHHLAQIERFDRVVFFEDGALDLDGSPDQLLQESSRFRALVAFDRG